MKIFIFFIFLGLLLESSCSSDTSQDSILLAKLHKSLQSTNYRQSGYSTLELAKLTTFAWDSVYFFHGEETSSFISATIKANWTGPDVPNLHGRLLFTYKNNFVSFIDLDNEYYEGQSTLPIFMYNCLEKNERLFSRSDAKFAAFRYCERGSQHYALIPIKCLKFPEYEEMIRKGCHD